MPIRLATTAPDFEARFAELLAMKREADEDVDRAVAAIIDDVRARGDAALIEYSRRFDDADLAGLGLAVSPGTVAAAKAACPQKALDSLGFAAERIRAYHERQKPADKRWKDSAGVELGWRWSAVESVGLYVPGGTASYPSSVLMNALPAKVAGVERLVMVVPAPHGEIAPLVLAAADLAGVDEIYRVGGAQAVAALAYGTATIRPVAKIVGPGNAFVAAAKRRVFGTVGIDMIAGPSEVVVVADGAANPAWIAADLLAQAEHDPAAQSILVTDDAALADAVEAALAAQLSTLPRKAIAEASWRDFGAVLLVRKLDEAPALVDRLAPEHLEIMAADCEALSKQVRNAGAIFLGAHTPEAVGDYVAGSNHVLPTARSARFASGLGVADFVKRTSLLKCDAAALVELGAAAIALAEAEGLAAHARSIAVRTNLQDRLMGDDERDGRRRLVAVILDEASLAAQSDEQSHERRVAIYDLVDENVFALPGREDGPYALMLALREARLAFDVRTPDGTSVATHFLSLTPFRSVMRDYFLVCESYYAAIRTATPDQIEAIDVSRRTLHDDGARVVLQRLAGKIEVDFDTARRLFTLLAALHWKGRET